MTCSPQFVGGAEASQKGLRQGIPQNVVSSVGLDFGMLSLQPRGDRNARTLSIGNGIHHLTSTVCAVAAGKKLWIGGLACHTIDEDSSAFKQHLRSLAFRQKTRMRSLTNR